MRRRNVIIGLGLTLLILAAGTGVFAITRGRASKDARNLPVRDDAEMREAIEAASRAAGFVPLQPTHFPTSANRLVLVDTGSRQAMIELVYESEGTIVVKGHRIRSTLEFFQLPGALKEPSGERIETGVDGAEVYRDVVDVDENGQPVKVTYTVIYADRTLVMDFTGEQPSEEGLRRMLEGMAIR